MKRSMYQQQRISIFLDYQQSAHAEQEILQDQGKCQFLD